MAKVQAKPAIRESADMSRNKELAGTTAYKDGYAVTYDDRGYAKKAAKTGDATYRGEVDKTYAENGYTTFSLPETTGCMSW